MKFQILISMYKNIKKSNIFFRLSSGDFKCGVLFIMVILITVKPVIVATSIEQATCIKQACIQVPKQANTLKCTCIKQAPVLSKQILIIP